VNVNTTAPAVSRAAELGQVFAFTRYSFVCSGIVYARRMGQPTQRATNYTARSNVDTAQIFLHANGQRPKRAPSRQRSRRRQRRGEPHTEHSLIKSSISPKRLLYVAPLYVAHTQYRAMYGFAPTPFVQALHKIW